MFLRIQVRGSSQTKVWIETENGMRQPRSQSSSAISDVTSPVKLVGKPPLVTRIARTGLGTRLGIRDWGETLKLFFSRLTGPVSLLH